MSAPNKPVQPTMQQSTMMPVTTTMTPFNQFPAMFPWGTDYMPSMSTMPYGGGLMSPFFGTSSSNMMMPFGGDMYNMRSNMMRMMDNMWRNFSNELTFMPSRPSSALENYYLINPVRTDAEGNRWLNCCFDMRSFKPEEINVTFNPKDRCITIEANHEVKDTKDHYVKRHYSRRMVLPESVVGDLSKVELKSCLTNEGMLTIEAQLPKMAITGPTSPMMTSAGAVTPVNVKVI